MTTVVPESIRLGGTIGMGTVGLLSMISAAFMLTSIIYFKLYTKLSSRLIAYLAISDFFQGMTGVLSFGWLSHFPVTGTPLCRLQGWMFTMFDNSSSFLVLGICSYTILCGFYQNRLNKRAFEWTVVALSYGISFIFATAGFGVETASKEFYGNVGVWCWITPAYNSYRFSFQYAYIFIIMFLLLVCYAWIGYKLYSVTAATSNVSTSREKLKARQGKLFKKLAFYPIIFFIVFFPLGLSRILTSFNHVVPVTYNYTAIAIFVSNGFWNAIVYGFTRNIWGLYKGTVFSRSAGSVDMSESKL